MSLAIFSAIIVLGAVGGAYVALSGVVGRQLGAALAFAAGVMLGAAFFHMLPESFHAGGYRAFSFVPGGFLALFLLERYLLVHVCEEPPDCQEHVHGHTLALTAFLGLSVHTLFDGVALGSADSEGVGLMAFIAIAAHKVPSSVALATILRGEGKGRSSVLAYALLFGLMVPLGALLYVGLSAIVPFYSFAAYALAFSAGTFLYISVSDLLPRVNRHGKGNRLVHIGGFVAGLALMLSLTFLPDHRF